MKMELRPQPDRKVQVTALDRQTGQSRSVTVYDATPEQVIGLVREVVAKAGKTDLRRVPAGAKG